MALVLPASSNQRDAISKRTKEALAAAKTPV
jgi:hypothetical protein